MTYNVFGRTTALYYSYPVAVPPVSLYVYHVASEKLVNLPTKVAAISVEICMDGLSS